MISIVIPAYNEEKTIDTLLTSLTHLVVPEPYEVIIVNNSSIDATAEIARTYLGRLPLRIIDEPRKGRGAARATGFAAAHGRIIFSTDADVEVPPDWITKIMPHFENPQVAAVSGTCRINDCGPFTNYLFKIIQPMVMLLYRIFFGAFWLTGSNFAIRKDVYQRAGGFNTTLNAQEDTELGFMVQKFGKIYWIHNVPMLTSGRRFKNGLLRGLLPYAVIFTKRYFFKRPDAVLSDER